MMIQTTYYGFGLDPDSYNDSYMHGTDVILIDFRSINITRKDDFHWILNFVTAGQEQRFDRVRHHRQGHQPHGWIPSLRYGQAGLCHDQGMLHRTQEEGIDLAQGKHCFSKTISTLFLHDETMELPIE